MSNNFFKDAFSFIHILTIIHGICERINLHFRNWSIFLRNSIPFQNSLSILKGKIHKNGFSNMGLRD